MLNKSTMTDIVSIFLILIGLLSFPYSHIFLYAGLFALSGAITNQLAIYMLFERVPFLYGSGVIEKNFEQFKLSIKNMVMSQFFTKDKLQSFFANEEQKIELAPIVEKADFSPAFDALSKTVMESKFGGAISMFGGESALEALREPFVKKLQSSVKDIVSSKTFKDELQNYIQNSTLSDDLIANIDKLVTSRLEELTPQMVKELIQELIKEHLGWLVVWGGVFGGAIGVISSFIL
jgi:uncharacterized membrane protein YheB (UPF0754 family)